MLVKEIELVPEGDMVLDREMLREAGLIGRVRVIVNKGEIRVLGDVEYEAENLLEDLAGCLGEEPVQEYDFDFKLGPLYEVG